MSVKDVVLNIATLGAHHRIQKATEHYEDRLDELKDLNALHEKRKEDINTLFHDVIEVKKAAIIELRKVKKITDALNVKQRQEIDHHLEGQDYSLDKIDSSMKAGEMAISATKGAVAGASTALGAWALVGTFGVASTGTAIGTLSGAAATNAILAWFGGGSLAAGGGGIAAGTAVLGGLVAIPVIAITGIFQHLTANKKIKRLKEEEIKIIELIDQIKKNLLAFDAIELRCKELIESITKALEAFEVIYQTSYKEIYPLGFISKVFKSIKKIFTKKYFSQKNIKQIQILGETTSHILKIVDSPVL